MGRNTIDLTGKRFGRWTVLERAPSSNGESMWRCVCDCGTERAAVKGDALRGGATRSCGCMRGRKEQPIQTDVIEHDESMDADDALTTDPDVRMRQLNLLLYSARKDAERAGAVYARAIRRMRQAEINFSRAVHERRQRAAQ
jgi:hypothetical protein